jgi:hypothetical protein
MNPDTMAWLWPVIATFFAVMFLLGALSPGKFSATSRLGLVDLAITAVVGLVLVRTLGSWNVVPPAVWFVPAGITVAGCVCAVHRWGALPLSKPGKPRSRSIVSTTASAVILLLVSAVVLIPG